MFCGLVHHVSLSYAVELMKMFSKFAYAFNYVHIFSPVSVEKKHSYLACFVCQTHYYPYSPVLI